MRQLTIIAALMISIPAFGQENIKPEASTGFNQFSVGVNISPDYCYRKLKNNDGSTMSDLIIGLRDEVEVAKLGYSIGINALLNTSSHLGFEIGMQFSNKGYSFKKTDLVFSTIIDPRFNFPYSTSSANAPTSAKINYSHYYLDIPFRAIFRLGEKKIQPIASIGITTNILLKSPHTAIYESDSSGTSSVTTDQGYDFKKLNFSPTVSIGINYKINNKLNLSAEPTFRYGLLKIIDTPITGYLWNAGLNITCYYVLK